MSLFNWFKGKPRRSLISEPINIVTGALGAGKTLFAIEQADLLRQHGDAKRVFQKGINEPDLRKLPELPFPLDEWYFDQHADLVDGAVIILDEFHKWMPQRSQGSRPPKFIEEMAECRKRGVRFILLTQSSEFDHFLKGTRLNRHFYVARKSGLGRATILEWMNRFVSNPEENEPARKQAIRHLWRHPVAQYGDWYVSAKSHHFRVRIPLRLWLVPVFLAAVVFFIFKATDVMGGLMAGERGLGALTASSDALAAADASPAGKGRTVYQDQESYLRQFKPVVPSMPWSAPAFQGRELATDPQLLCVMAGHDGADGCRCYTEQLTPYTVEDHICRRVAREGIYNPHRAPYAGASSGVGSEPDGKADSRPRPAAAAPAPLLISGSPSPGSGGVGGVPPTGNALPAL